MPRTCWAVVRGDCRGKISNEHVFSPKLWVDSTIQLHGFTREIFRRAQASPNDLKAKVLCQHHNNVLTDLDSEAIALQNVLRKRLQSEEPEVLDARVDGWRLERWVMKCTGGVFAAGWAEPGVPPGKRRGFVAGREILDVIFGDAQLPADRGLCIVTSPALRLLSATNHLGWSVLTDRSDETKVIGLLIQLTGLGLTVAAAGIAEGLRALPPPDPNDELAVDWRAARVLLRPREVTYRVKRGDWKRDGCVRISFSW